MRWLNSWAAPLALIVGVVGCSFDLSAIPVMDASVDPAKGTDVPDAGDGDGAAAHPAPSPDKMDAGHPHHDAGDSNRSDLDGGMPTDAGMRVDAGDTLDADTRGDAGEVGDAGTGKSATFDDWTVVYDLTFDAYQAAVVSRISLKQRPMYVTGYARDGVDLYAAIFAPENGIVWLAHHGANHDTLIEQTHAAAADGYHPVVINGFDVNGTTLFATLYEYDPSVKWEWWYSQTHADYQNQDDRLSALGYQVVHVSCYTIDGEPRYTGLWEQKAAPAFKEDHGIYAADYDTEARSLALQGYQPVQIDVDDIGAGLMVSDVFHAQSAPIWQVARDLHTSTLAQTLLMQAQAGFRPRTLSFYANGSRAALSWEHRDITAGDAGPQAPTP